MTSPTGRSATRLLPLLLLCAVAALGTTPGEAEAQAGGLKGVQVESSFLWTTLVGGAFPHDETGIGATLGARYRWPTGLSLGLMGLHAQPEDLSLPGTDRRRTMRQWGLLGEVRYHLTRLTPVRPYIGGRLGWTSLSDERDVKGSGLAYGVTAGTEIWPADQVAFRVAATAGGLSVSDFLEEGTSTSGATWTLEAGVSVFFGEERRPSDTDGDGVRNSADRCAGTPAGVQVDSQGCPIDADRDGVADYEDACPGTWSGARVDDRGCALDDDDDGVPNGLDECPDTEPGAAVNDQGCAQGSGGAEEG